MTCFDGKLIIQLKLHNFKRSDNNNQYIDSQEQMSPTWESITNKNSNHTPVSPWTPVKHIDGNSINLF